MTIKTHSSSSSPIINERKPESIERQFIREKKPSQTAWLTTIKRLIKTPNIRSAFLWITGGILFSLVGKGVLQRREKELMIEDIDNYLKNKQKKID